jgi:HEAT repeat protein
VRRRSPQSRSLAVTLVIFGCAAKQPTPEGPKQPDGVLEGKSYDATLSATLCAAALDRKAALAQRQRAIIELGQVGGPEALEALKRLSHDPAEPIRVAAAGSLGGMPRAEARPILEEQLSREESVSVREALQRALTRMEP